MLRWRLWLVAVLFVALTVLIEVGLRYAGIGAGWRMLVLAALCYLVGLEGATLRRWTLSLRGYRTIGAVVADNRDEAEQRFFINWAATRKTAPASAPAAPPPEPAIRPRISSSDVIGSFPQPEPPR